MPKRATLSIVFTAAALVLLLNFRTPAVAGIGLAGQTGANGGYHGAANPGAGTAGSASAGGGVTGTSSGTITGPSVDTPFGALQVAVVLSNGKITDVQVLAYPSSHGRSVAINQYALPVLRQEVLQAQSANVNAVSGATYTSQAYMQSLQAALDQAK